MKRFVIAITRTCGSCGTIVGKMLSNDLKINMYDRELLRLALAAASPCCSNAFKMSG